MLVDSHCHINFDAFDEDRDAVIERARAANISHMLCVSVTLEDFPSVYALANQHDHIYASVGVHPCYPDCKEPSVDELVALANDRKIIAIGETGLDYFRMQREALDWQRARFVNHIEAAKITEKPLIIHTRNAKEDTMAILEQHEAQAAGGVMHCFAEDWDMAKRALDIGFYISFSGIVTFNSAKTLQEVARKMPLDRILVETDAPYLAPVPNRGKRNEPSFVTHTAAFIAELKGVDFDAIAETTTANFMRLFKSVA